MQERDLEIEALERKLGEMGCSGSGVIGYNGTTYLFAKQDDGSFIIERQ